MTWCGAVIGIVAALLRCAALPLWQVGRRTPVVRDESSGRAEPSVKSATAAECGRNRTFGAAPRGWAGRLLRVRDWRPRLLQAHEGRVAAPDPAVPRLPEHPKAVHVGGPAGQGRYLNAAAELDTSLPADELLRTLLAVEQRLGRERQERYGPRTIDLDLLLYGTLTSESPELTLPHPRMHEREFVLQPLAEIAPNLVHPELGRTILELLEEVRKGQRPSEKPTLASLS